MAFLKTFNFNQVFNSSNSNTTSPSSPSSNQTSTPPPITSNLISFQNAWSTIKNTLSSPTHRHHKLESTSIKSRLDLMWDCLALENHIPVSVSNPNRSSAGSNQTGECVEYFLKHDVPGTLVALSLHDQPVGVKGLVIGFFLSLVVFMDENFVVHAKVHKPLVRLLRSCVEPELDIEEGDDVGWRTKESAYEEAVVEVMCHLCSRIKTFPELLVVFLQNRSSTNSHSGPTSSWPPSPKPLPTSNSSSPSQSPAPTSLTHQARKSVHFSPQPRALSPTPSLLSVAGNTMDSNLQGSSIASSTLDGPTRRSTASSLDSPSPTLKADSDMLIFSYLLRFLHREGRTGDLARAGLLFLMELAMGRRANSSEGVASGLTKPGELASIAFGEWILDSDFADVLGAGLGAAYGLLPSKLIITPRRALDSGQASGGMVLGDMGTHLTDDDIGQNKEEREREQRRERLWVGLGVSGSEEFRAQMDLFLKLIEFTQDVLRNTSSSGLDDYYLSASDPPRSLDPADQSIQLGPTPSEIVASAISSSVLSSIRNLFLNAIMYPSILECSEADGSAVAVMSYLEAMLSLLETDGELADEVLRFLMTEDDEGSDRVRRAGGKSKPSREAMARRRKSGAMQIIQAEFNKAKPHRRARSGADGLTSMSETGITYFNSLGRFTLKDLLINNVRSANQATATAALKLLHVILNRHDRYALALLDISPDPCATAFPYPNDLQDFLGGANHTPKKLTGYVSDEHDDEDELEEFTYPLTGTSAPSSKTETGGEEAEEEEEFKYPIAEPHTPARRPSLLTSTPATPHFLKPALELAEQIQCSPCPTYRSHRDALDYLTSLIEMIDPSGTVMKPDTSEHNPLSTAFGHYLLDAEAELTSTATFRRGLLSDYVSASVVGPTHEPSSPMEWIDDPVVRHQLAPDGPLLSSLLEALSRFFGQSPELNLILTGCVASLASCPTRSLDAWLLPVLSNGSGRAWEERVPSQTLERDVDEGDDRSIDCVVDELVAADVEKQADHQRSVSASRSGWLFETKKGVGGDGVSVLEIYRQLAEQVVGYRRTIEGFERYLQERRQGLVFVENLEDALEGALEGLDEEMPSMVPGFGGGSKARPSKGVVGSKGKDHSSFFASLFGGSGGGLKAKSKSTIAVSKARGMGTPVTPTDRSGGFQPFSEHYRQTNSIMLEVVPIETPSSLKQPSNLRDSSSDGEDEDEGNGPESPTRKTRNGKSLEEEVEQKKEKRSGVGVEMTKLSRVLDNVVVLEEALKEIGAIVSGRKSLGIDPVRFL